MCESLENETPTRKRFLIHSSLSHFSDRKDVISILALEYAQNNIGEKKAIKWLAKIFDVFEDEIEDSAYRWMDLGEGMKEFLSANRPDSNISVTEFHRLLELDCSTINSDAFTQISDAIGAMSAMEVKWFIRYWLRTPRNGVNRSTVEKAMADYYQEDVKKHSVSHSLTGLIHYLENNIEPPQLVHGNYVKPMLAKKYLGKLPERYIMDIKYDGNRYQIHRDYGSTIIFNRKGKIVTDQYSDVVELMSQWGNGIILDAEIYPVDSEGSPAKHQSLATRVHSKDKQKAIANCPVKLAVFDCLMYNGQSLLDDTYSDRLDYLEESIPSEYIAQSFTHGNVEAAYNVAINAGFEGVMIKDLDAVYQSKRTTSLLKFKPPRIELDVTITSGEFGNGKKAGMIATYGVSVRSESGYTEIGKVGSGISDAEMDELSVRLKRIVDSYTNNKYFFLPRVVLEVTCDAITKNKDGTYGMRFPRIVRIRDDKYPVDSNTIQDVEDMCSNIY
jgi:DNA ligase-1|tara:strand:+ start:1454 stop:2956 length:1503 start_codon:yes stop_codon:yes gene_type:complete